MSWKNAHHDRGPPATAQAMVEADEIVIGTYLVVADPGLVVAGEDAVVVGPAEVTIEPEVVLISRDAPRQTPATALKSAVSKGSPQPPR